jgi:hypothetical protein
MAERWEGQDATTWVTGIRGGSQSCDAVCADALCGPTREEECPEPPTCVSEALAALWADTACAIHTEGRLDAGTAAVSSCSECGPADYSNAYCLPGVIDTSPGTAYYGTSTSGSSAATLCAVQYTDERTEPLCPCLLPALGSFLGWYIVIWMSVASTVYLGGGVAYGRHKNPQSDEPFMNWHPHRWHWGELVELCYDGFGFSMAHWRAFRGDTNASYDPIMRKIGGGEEVEKDDDEESGLGTQSKQRRRSEPAAGPGRDEEKARDGDSPNGKRKKKKKKSKPRPPRRSLPTQLDAETKQWLTSAEPGVSQGGGDGALE